MLLLWEVIVTVLVINTAVIDGNRIFHRRRKALDTPLKSVNKNTLQSNQQIPKPQGKSESVSRKTVARQFYPYQRSYGYGSIQGINYPYAGSGVGVYQYGYGEYGQIGQGSGQYAAYYNNRYPGSYSFYPGFNSVGSYESNNYAPQGGNYYGRYFWNNGQKRTINKFVVCIFSLVSLIIY